MTVGQIVLVVAVLGAVGFGLWRARTDGRFGDAAASHASGGGEVAPGGSPDEAARPAAATPPVSVLAGTEFAGRLGAQATLVQFSSAFCAPCRATRRTLAEVAEVVPGVTHLEIDAELHLDLVRTVGVLRTPTTLVLDRDGVEVTRAVGAPRKEQVLAALGQAVE